MEEDGAGAVRMTGGKEQAQEEEEEGVVLDLTGSQLHDLQQVELPLTLRELDLTANRLATLDCRFASLSSLYKLSLRQNLLSDESLSPLPSWTSLSGLQISCLECASLSQWYQSPGNSFPMEDLILLPLAHMVSSSESDREEIVPATTQLQGDEEHSNPSRGTKDGDSNRSRPPSEESGEYHGRLLRGDLDKWTIDVNCRFTHVPNG